MANKGSVYTRKVIAQLLNLSEKRIRQLTQDGVLEEYSSGCYQLVPTVQSYIKYLQRQISDDDMASDYNTEKARLTKAKREKEEMELLLKKNELHAAKDVKFAVTNMLINFKAKLTVLPHKILPALMETQDKHKTLEIITVAIREALEELSSYNPDTVVTIDYEDELMLEDEGEEFGI